MTSRAASVLSRYRAVAPMTTPSSTSQSVFVEPRGTRTPSYGPIRVLGSFMKTTGSPGTAAPVSAAWSR
jgi:hypothetical protein